MGIMLFTLFDLKSLKHVAAILFFLCVFHVVGEGIVPS